MNRLLVILGNQLFPVDLLESYRHCRIFMAEDLQLCTYEKHHKQKIALFLASMRSYADQLRSAGFIVHYESLPAAQEGYETKLSRHIAELNIDQLLMWEIEDQPFENRMIKFAEQADLQLELLPSPMFLTTRDEFRNWLGTKRPRMASFYQWQRQRLRILLDAEGKPLGGRWSFDADNRKPLPKRLALADVPRSPATEHLSAVIPLVNQLFPDHPGILSLNEWWLPTTRAQTLDWLDTFLEERLAQFGPYEDALTTRHPTLFHSVLSPTLNLGLVTPDEVVERVLSFSEEHEVPINSLEGLVRQLIGWREFIRGIYQNFGSQQESSNFFNHQRQLSSAWYEGTTGLLPMDEVIKKALSLGWTHHIERLMIAGNLFTLCEIEPRAAYRWFMELFVDSSEWVMVPNVYGMGTFADGGVFSTKPYICGSNYIRKMGDYPKPRDQENSMRNWCTTMDGLYWRFVDKNREFFRGQARMAQMVGNLDRMDTDRRKNLFAAAEDFIKNMTV